MASGAGAQVGFAAHVPNGSALDPFLDAKARALLDVLPPQATVDVGLPVASVPVAADGTLVGGTDASYYFVTYDLEPPPCFDVFCVHGVPSDVIYWRLPTNVAVDPSNPFISHLRFDDDPEEWELWRLEGCLSNSDLGDRGEAVIWGLGPAEGHDELEKAVRLAAEAVASYGWPVLEAEVFDGIFDPEGACPARVLVLWPRAEG